MNPSNPINMCTVVISTRHAEPLKMMSKMIKEKVVAMVTVERPLAKKSTLLHSLSLFTISAKFAAGVGENLVLMKALITDLKEDLEAEAAKHSGALRTLCQTWSSSGTFQVDGVGPIGAGKESAVRAATIGK